MSEEAGCGENKTYTIQVVERTRSDTDSISNPLFAKDTFFMLKVVRYWFYFSRGPDSTID